MKVQELHDEIMKTEELILFLKNMEDENAKAGQHCCPASPSTTSTSSETSDTRPAPEHNWKWCATSCKMSSNSWNRVRKIKK